MRKVLIIFGTRPEAIKLAPLIYEFKKRPEEFNLKICITAQHREMLDQILKTFELEADIDLDIMRPNQSLYDITKEILHKVEVVLKEENPDIVMVHGDTTTSLVAALAAFYLHIPVGHVEAGLRTNNLFSPWPEEMNRQLTDRISKYHFAPTKLNRENLIKENIDESNIVVTGNTVIDALYFILNRLSLEPERLTEIESNLKKSGYDIKSRGKKVVLVTGHRRENFGQGLLNICEAIKEIAIMNINIDIVYPVHLNPNVRAPVKKILSNLSNVFLIEPLEYEPFVYLMNYSYLILTDSGGVQEEAPSLGKPVLVLRDTTERPEALEAGTVKLVATNKSKIVKVTNELLSNINLYEKMSMSHNPYGDGLASSRIIKHLIGK